MTFKLEPGLARITSPIILLFPDHTTRRFSSGEDAVRETFDKRWKVTEMRARDGEIEIIVEEAVVPEINALGEETFF